NNIGQKGAISNGVNAKKLPYFATAVQNQARFHNISETDRFRGVPKMLRQNFDTIAILAV
ncbi:unnamed protein product, partial [marine sediment metagenome]